MIVRPRSLARMFLLALVALVAACGASASSIGGGIRRGGASDPTAYDAAVKAGDAAWEQRADRAQLEAAIASWEQAVKLKDDDYETYEKLSRAEYLYADGWLVFEQAANKELFLRTYEKGFQYAERGMKARYPAIEQRLDAGVDLKDAAQLVDKPGIGLLYWYATNLGKWGNAQDITVVLTYKDRIYAIMEQVLNLDPNFFYGAADRYFGAYYAIAPSFAGGDLDMSWKHFEATRKIEPNYLATYNLIAEFYAPKRQDLKLFNEMIERVRNADVNAIPALAPEATIEKKKAELLAKRQADGEFPF